MLPRPQHPGPAMASSQGPSAQGTCQCQNSTAPDMPRKTGALFLHLSPGSPTPFPSGGWSRRSDSQNPQRAHHVCPIFGLLLPNRCHFSYHPFTVPHHHTTTDGASWYSCHTPSLCSSVPFPLTYLSPITQPLGYALVTGILKTGQRKGRNP